MQSPTFLIVALGYLVFGISAVIWISKKKKAGEKISLRAKIIIVVVFLAGPNILLTMIETSPAPETNVPEASTTYYVKAKSTNVRECPSTSCKVIDSLVQNTPLTFPGDLFDKYPDWAEITFPNGEIGYVSKTTLSENTVPESQLTPTDDSSSVGGITIGPWSNIQMTLGDSYELYFCEPPSAISGATCGTLADTTTDPKGGTPPYSFIKKSGFLPPGITLELNGTLKGAPTQEGTYNFRLCAKDLYGGEGCQNLTVFVSKAEIPAAVQTPVTEDVEFSKIESATCQALGRSVPNNPNSWIVYRVTVTGTGGASIGGGIGFSCDSRYGGGPCHKQLSSCDSWTAHPEYQSCRREADQPEITRWTYRAEGAINVDMGFNFGVQAGHADKVIMNVSCK